MKIGNVLTLIGLAGLAIGWLFSVEYRLGTYQATLDVSERVKNLEDLLLPVLIEFRAREIAGGRDGGQDGTEPPIAVPEVEPGVGFSSRAFSEAPSGAEYEEARKWANDAIMAPQMQAE